MILCECGFQNKPLFAKCLYNGLTKWQKLQASRLRYTLPKLIVSEHLSINVKFEFECLHYYVMLWYVMRSYVMLCIDKLCYDMLCSGMLCYVMICYVMLWRINLHLC